VVLGGGLCGEGWGRKIQKKGVPKPRREEVPENQPGPRPQKQLPIEKKSSEEKHGKPAKKGA